MGNNRRVTYKTKLFSSVWNRKKNQRNHFTNTQYDKENGYFPNIMRHNRIELPYQTSDFFLLVTYLNSLELVCWNNKKKSWEEMNLFMDGSPKTKRNGTIFLCTWLEFLVRNEILRVEKIDLKYKSMFNHFHVDRKINGILSWNKHFLLIHLKIFIWIRSHKIGMKNFGVKII